MLNNKRGQFSETLVWIVATIIVVITLIVSLLVSKTVFPDKEIKPNQIDHLLAQKSLTSYVHTIGRENLATKTIREADSSLLIFKIFEGFPGVWAGIFVDNIYDASDVYGKIPTGASGTGGSGVLLWDTYGLFIEGNKTEIELFVPKDV